MEPDKDQLIEEKKKIRSDKERAAFFETMMQTPGWELYVKLLNHHIQQRMEALIQPTPSLGEMAAEHNKGTVFGLTLARDLPRGTVEAAKTSGPATDEDDNE